MSLSRRRLLQGLGSAALVAGPLRVGAQTPQQVVVVGGGFGGATAAKYLKRFNPALSVTLVEPLAQFVSCPLSNRVIYGGMQLSQISHSYEAYVNRHGLRWVRAAAEGIDPQRREVRAGGQTLRYDRLVLSPGVDYVYEQIEGLQGAAEQALVPHAWKAGPQTQQLRNLLRAMPDGGTVAMHIPKAPYRCPPGPYERASLIAHYLKTSKPRSKLMVFDANPEIQAKKGLFETVWRERYAAQLSYEPNAELERVDAAGGSLHFALQGVHKADVMNVIPPQRAGRVARSAGLANVGQRWCGVDFLSYESTAVPGVHVLGDSVAGAPGMPKSGHMANQHGKVCAGAIAALSLGQPVPDQPIIANTCYSFISHNEAIHVAAVYRYDATKRLMVPAPGAGGLSDAPSAAEGIYAMGWATNIISDTLK
jgi:NADPH-dependent 2,4-dienoyl-CoA reductase/sulfur reductase-like enzyme